MKLILHIGYSKCGSSSIQASLLKAKSKLLANGVLYHPATAGGHFSYITLLGGQTRGNDAEQRKAAELNIAETRKIIAQKSPEYLILSSENFFNVHPERLIGIAKKIVAKIDQIHIIAYLRHPVDLYLSGVQQGLKGSHTFVPPQDFVRDLSATFDRWIAYGADSITARLFDRRRLKGGTVTADFQDVLHKILSRNAIRLPAVETNTSLSAEQMVVLQDVRREFLADRIGSFAGLSNWMIRFFEDMNRDAGRPIRSKPRLREEVRACILERNRALIERLDQALPDLHMGASQQVDPVEWQASSARWDGRIGSLLADCDETAIATLRALLPMYRPDWLSTLPERAFDYLDNLHAGPEINNIYAQYLRRNGLVEVSELIGAGKAGIGQS